MLGGDVTNMHALGTQLPNVGNHRIRELHDAVALSMCVDVYGL